MSLITKELRTILAENGIACWGAVSLMFEGRDLIHADESGARYVHQLSQ